MKASDFRQQIGGTSACMNITMKDTKGCGKMSSNGTLFYDSWFNELRTSDEAKSEVVDYCGPAETGHKVFCPAKLENQ